MFAEVGADLDLKSWDGQTALMVALSHKNESFALKLIDCGADVSVKTDKGPSALNLASQNNQVSVVEQIISKNISAEVINHQDKSGNTSLMLSSYFGNTKIVELLLEANAQVDITNPSRNASFCSPLQRVLQIGLVQENANDRSSRESTGSFALFLASSRGNTDIVDLLLKEGAGVDLQDSEGVTSLMRASYYGHIIKTTRSLLQYDADVDLQDKQGWSALMFAVTQNHESIAVLLARKRALINMQNASGTSSQLLLRSQKYDRNPPST